jgi:hypothetical protein
VNHFAFTKAETTIVLFGVGPVDFTYVNAADDPMGVTEQERPRDFGTSVDVRARAPGR